MSETKEVMSVLKQIGNDPYKRKIVREVERYPEQLSLHLHNTTDATPEEFQEWREKDFFSKGDFDPLLAFVVIPTVIQVSAFFFMLAVFAFNDNIF
tara:strand:- start:494 stop:781 length:288 start_codon:yes stop_codon:yes gene_type:complete